jgi:hypothetical protein
MDSQWGLGKERGETILGYGRETVRFVFVHIILVTVIFKFQQ